MRELSPWARKSQGRDEWRSFYAGYIKSPEWFRRRTRWAEDELRRIAPARVMCLGSCGKDWRVSRDDLHHSSYDRLGDEDHEDLWPLCRGCHTRLHTLLDSSRSWKRMDKWVANQQAILVIQQEHAPVSPMGAGAGLRSYL